MWFAGTFAGTFFDSIRLICHLFRLRNEANFAAMCKRKNEAVQIQIVY
jgi:hypothetical protein